ncbi:MAG TPA: hypothetical protein DD424_02575, partial [Porphyromonadaceae bacterium]|nr:hypothetical protein [Porphyromonadaceae bacterium]
MPAIREDEGHRCEMLKQAARIHAFSSPLRHFIFLYKHHKLMKTYLFTSESVSEGHPDKV